MALPCVLFMQECTGDTYLVGAKPGGAQSLPMVVPSVGMVTFEDGGVVRTLQERKHM